MLTIWCKPQLERPDGERPREYIIRHLKFTGAQIRAYDPLIKEHQRVMNDLWKESMPYREALYKLLKNNEVPNKAIDSVAGLLANNQKQIELVTFHHFEKVREICTTDQKADFDSIIGSVLKKMNSDRSGPPHGSPAAEDPGNTRGPIEETQGQPSSCQH